MHIWDEIHHPCGTRVDVHLNGKPHSILTKAFPGRWKVVGEDLYAAKPSKLVERLKAREDGWTDWPVTSGGNNAKI